VAGRESDDASVNHLPVDPLEGWTGATPAQGTAEPRRGLMDFSDLVDDTVVAAHALMTEEEGPAHKRQRRSSASPGPHGLHRSDEPASTSGRPATETSSAPAGTASSRGHAPRATAKLDPGGDARLDDPSFRRVVSAETEIQPGAYSQREDFLIKQEAEGEISFCYVLNDGTPQNMIYLTGLKNIFSKQLPNMPKASMKRCPLHACMHCTSHAWGAERCSSHAPRTGVHLQAGIRPKAPVCSAREEERAGHRRHHVPSLPPAGPGGDCLLRYHLQRASEQGGCGIHAHAPPSMLAPWALAARLNARILRGPSSLQKKTLCLISCHASNSSPSLPSLLHTLRTSA
jgi:hypothetical protein